MTPQIARLRNDTYFPLKILINLSVELSIKEGDNVTILPNTELKNVLLGKIPICCLNLNIV